MWGHKMWIIFRIYIKPRLLLWLTGKESTCNAGDAGSILGKEDLLEKGMAEHSNILVCRIPWTVEPGGLLSILSQRVGHDRSHLAHLHTYIKSKEPGVKYHLSSCWWSFGKSSHYFLRVKRWGGAKMAEEWDWETTFSPTNSSKEQLNAEQISQNNFWSLAEDIRQPEKQPIVFEGR